MKSGEFSDKVFATLPWWVAAVPGEESKFSLLKLPSGRKALTVFSTKTRALHFIDGRPGLQACQVGSPDQPAEGWKEVGLMLEALAEAGTTDLVVDPEPLGYTGERVPALLVRLVVILDEVHHRELDARNAS